MSGCADADAVEEGKQIDTANLRGETIVPCSDGRVFTVLAGTDTTAVLLLFFGGRWRQIAVVAVLQVAIGGQGQIQVLRAALQRTLLAFFFFDYIARVLFVDARPRFTFAYSSSTT